MAEGPADQIEDLRRQIDQTVGLDSLQEQRADVWLDIEGQGIDAQSASSSLLASYLDVVRKGVQSIAEINLQGQAPTRRAKDLQEACDLRLVALRQGSVRIGLRLPTDFEEGDHPILAESRRAASSALTEYLDVAQWAAQIGDEQWLSERFPEPAKRKVLLGAVKSLAPGRRSTVDRVSLSGRRVPGVGPLTLTQGSNRHLKRALEHLVEARHVSYEGVLREIDLDKRTFLIRQRQPQGSIVRCSFPESLLSRAKQALDRPVRVTGLARRTGRRGTVALDVEDLAVAGE
jgi:hypothetical protein